MIRTKLTAWNCAILALVLAVTGIAIYFTTKRTLYKAIDDVLLQRAQYFAASWHGWPPVSIGLGDAGEGVGSGPGPGLAFTAPLEPKIDPDTARSQGIDPNQLNQVEAFRKALRPIVLDLNGKDVVMPNTQAMDWETFAKAKAGETSFGFAMQNGIRLRVLSFPMRKDGNVYQIIQIASPTITDDQALAQLAKTLTIILPLAVTLMLMVGVVLTRRALRPVSHIASTAEQIEVTNLSDRLNVVGNDEFAQLSSTFNGLLERLQHAFQDKDEAFAQLRRFTADASHELKTPLTTIQLRTGLALRKETTPPKYIEHLKAIDRAAGQMNSVVQDLLFLAASDEGQLVLRKSQANLAEVIEDALVSVDTSNHTIERFIEPELNLEIDSGAMTRVMMNIVKNAATYSEAGQSIRIEARKIDGSAIVEVTDRGEGIPASHVPLIFERFHRVDSSRFRDSGGSGLGLAIAKAIVELHGGTISLESEVRQGTTVTITLPLSPA